MEFESGGGNFQVNVEQFTHLLPIAKSLQVAFLRPQHSQLRAKLIIDTHQIRTHSWVSPKTWDYQHTSHYTLLKRYSGGNPSSSIWAFPDMDLPTPSSSIHFHGIFMGLSIKFPIDFPWNNPPDPPRRFPERSLGEIPPERSPGCGSPAQWSPSTASTLPAAGGRGWKNEGLRMTTIAKK